MDNIHVTSLLHILSGTIGDLIPGSDVFIVCQKNKSVSGGFFWRSETPQMIL